MSAINLIPAARLEAKRRKRQIRRCLAACGIYTLIAGAAGVAALMTLGSDDPAVRRQIGIVEEEIRRLDQGLAQAHSRLAATQLVLETNRQIVQRPDWSQLLALLAQKSGEQVVLRTCLLKPVASAAGDGGAPAGAFTLTLMGMARSAADAQDYAIRLQNTNLFDRVTLVDTRREPFLGLETSAFRVECELGGGPAPAPTGPKDNP